MSRPSRHFYEFGPFRVDATERVLFRHGEVVSLKPKVFDTLLVLVESSGHVIEKDELMKTLWPDTVVEENNLNQNISALRRALGDGERSGQYIETLPRRGYRFVASVRESRGESPDLVLEKHTLSSFLIEEEEPENRTTETRGHVLLQARRTGLWVSKKVVIGSALTATLAAVAAAYFFISSKSAQPERISAIKSIAVLPFKPLGADGNDEYLGLGMTDALITKLGSVNAIIVRPTSAVRKYTAQGQDPLTAGLQLKVDSVLDGSIQKVGDRLRLTVQLVSVPGGRHLWADKFDEEFTDIFTIEDRISGRVAAALSLKLTGAEQNLIAKHHTENPEAYQLYLKGQYFWNKRTEESLEKSKEYFEQAIARDPKCALAYGGLSDYYVLIAGTHGPKEIPKAREAAVKALEIDETLAEPHTVLGFIKWRYDADWQGAERELTRAIDLNPNYELAHDRYAIFLSQMGRTDESLAELKKAQELDPFSLLINARLAVFLSRARQYDRALEQCRKTLELDENYPLAHRALASVYEQTGMKNEAIAEIEKVIAVLGSTEENLARLGCAYALAGNKREATKILNEMKALSKEKYVDPGSIALVHASLGEKDQAFEWLNRALQQGEVPNGLKVDPEWDSLRSDGRFTDLLRRIGLAPLS